MTIDACDGGIDLRLKQRTLVALLFVLLGSVLANHAINLKFRYKQEKQPFNPLEYLVSLWFGLFFFSIPVAYLYFVLPFNPKPLDLYDWSAAIFSVLLMPLFEALRLLPTHWFNLVFFPAFYLNGLRLIYRRYSRYSLMICGLAIFIPFYIVSFLFPNWAIDLVARIVKLYVRT